MNQGFIQIPILFAVLAGIVIFGGAGYVAYEASQNTQVQTEELEIESNPELPPEKIGDVSTTTAIEASNDDVQKEISSQSKTTAPAVFSEAPVPPAAAQTQISFPTQTQTPVSNTIVENPIIPSPASVVIPSPKVKVAANPSSVEYGGSSVISWVATDALSCTVGSSPVLLAVAGSQSVSPTNSDWSKSSKTTYTVTCTGNGGSVSENVTVTVQSWEPSAECKAAAADTSTVNGYELSPTLCSKLTM
ncbi:MAG: hypothetical protein RLZZ480_252 [Candidatus Parcubacteria bacterium]|jgi:hypothetical protein